MAGQGPSRKDIEAGFLEDARLLISCTEARGRTPAELLSAWDVAESEFMNGALSIASLQALREATEASLAKIAPTTLADIRERPSESKRSLIFIVFYVLSVAVLFGSITYSGAYIRLRDNVTHLEQLQSANIEDLALRFYEDYHDKEFPGFVTEKIPTSLEKDHYLDRIEKLHDYDRQLSTYLSESVNLTKQAYGYDPLVHWVENGLSPRDPLDKAGYKQIENSPPPASSPVVSLPRGSQVGSPPFVSPAPAGQLAVRGETNPSLGAGTTPSASIQRPSPLIEPASGNATAARASGDPNSTALDPGEMQTFFLNTNLPTVFGIIGASTGTDVSTSISWIIYKENSDIETIGAIILPAFLGALGTLVYFIRPMTEMRLGLSRFRSTPAFDPVRLILRVLMGAMAGVSGSIFASTVNHAQGGTYSSGVGLFLLAFLLGFSVDLFFRTLDMLVHNVAVWLHLPDNATSAQEADPKSTGRTTTRRPTGDAKPELSF